MKTMIDPDLLEKFLAGEATDDEARQCEAALKDPDICERLGDQVESRREGDSLVETLRNLGQQTRAVETDAIDAASLVVQLQSLVGASKTELLDLDHILDPSESPDELGRIGPYRVVELIAGGGMGLVFKAEDPKLGRPVCIKVLKPELAKNPESKARFAREIQAAARLRNSRITTVFEFGEHRNLPFLVMELLEGMSLRDKLRQQGPFCESVARKLTIQIAEGLRYAHGLGYLHRDIKPENIWVTPEGDAKLLDFGLARSIEGSVNLTHSGTILGTPNYMSPEQVQGKELDARSDLFSVGSVMFEMLTGETPFGKSNLFSTMMSVANQTLAFPDHEAGKEIPDELRNVISKLLQKNPDDRLASADQLVSVLSQSDSSPDASSISKDRDWHGKGLFGLLGGVAGAAVLALGLLLFQYNDKGTLVVEADPSVDVRISNDSVSVHDPQTDEKFSVTIGDHPLPSGVYQLQMSDPSGKYTLSSEVIVIRRGEKQIVKIQLKPATPDSVATVVPEEIAEPFAESATTLESIPTLDAAELRRKIGIEPGKPILRNALVSRPAQRKGVSSWSIEPAFSNAIKPKLNFDGSRIASIDRIGNSKVAIWDRGGQPTHILPAQDVVKQIQWSPNPNIIAVVENGKIKKQVVVWKLFEKHAEVIDVVPADGSKVAWSADGLLLAIQTQRQVSFVDLSKGSVFAFPNFGVEGRISDHPWSADGRYFASTVENDVKIWDLKGRKLFHIFSGKEGASFLPNSNRVALYQDANWEVWDLDSFVRERVIEPNENRLTQWPSPKFDRIAGTTANGDLLISDLVTGQEVRSKIDVADRYDNDETRLHLLKSGTELAWSGDGKTLLFGDGWYQSRSISAPNETNALSNLAMLKQLPKLARRYVSMRNSRQGSTTSVSASNRLAYFHFITQNSDGTGELGAIAGFDLNTMEHFPPSEFNVAIAGAFCSISPNGKHVAILGSDALPKRGVMPKQWSEDMKKVRIVDVATGKLIRTIETGTVKGFEWSSDSKRLVIASLESKKESVTVKKLLGGTTGSTFERYLKRYDENKDRSLSQSEAEEIVEIKWDRDGNGAVSANEFAAHKLDSMSESERTESFVEMSVVIHDVESGVSVPLTINTNDFEEPNLRFERFSSIQYGDAWKPMLSNNQICLPLFELASFRNGKRTGVVDSTGRASYWKDKIGLFDVVTGKLTEVVETNLQFGKGPISVSDHFFSVPTDGTQRYKSTSLIDRTNTKLAFVVGRQQPIPVFTDYKTKREWYRRARTKRSSHEGVVHLSPNYPFVVSMHNKALHFWKLDSNSKTLDVQKIISIGDTKSSSSNRTLVGWHPAYPTFAWRSGTSIRLYNVETDESFSFDANQAIVDLKATHDGWLAIGYYGLVLLDNELGMVKTYLPTNRFSSIDEPGTFDQCVTATGEILKPEGKPNLRAIQLRGNKVETLMIDQFEQMSLDQ